MPAHVARNVPDQIIAFFTKNNGALPQGHA